MTTKVGKVVPIADTHKTELWMDKCLDTKKELDELKEKINTPEIEDFLSGVEKESQHQRARWSKEHDDFKNGADWFWLVGYLAGKALTAYFLGDLEKAKHHCISTAAVLYQWHDRIKRIENGLDEYKGNIGVKKNASSHP